MSKKTTTTTTGSNNTAFQYNQAGMDQYNQNVNTVQPFLRNNITNPFGQQFQFENTMGQDQAARLGQRNVSNIFNNARAMGYSTNGGLVNSMLSAAGRATSGGQAQAFRSAVGNAYTRQFNSAQLAQGFQPLMIGSNANFDQTQTTKQSSSLVPQLISAGIGAALAPFTGGASIGGILTGAAKGFTGSFGDSGSGGGGGGYQGPSPFMMPPPSSGYGYGNSNGFQSNGSFVNPFMFGGRN